MGILNLTPDSFSDGGKFTEENAMRSRIDQMIDEGTDIIDLGGASSRPGSSAISAEEEWNRIEPALKYLNSLPKPPLISVDTYSAFVARSALDAGAHIINDISAGAFDSDLLPTLASYSCPYILMHRQGDRSEIHQAYSYSSVTAEVMSWISHQIQRLLDIGLADIWIDPGFGFSKNTVQNYELLRQLSDFGIFNRPLVTGISRKSMISKVTRGDSSSLAAAGSALHFWALQSGTSIIRTHDVREAKDTITLYQHLFSPKNNQENEHQL